MDIWECHRKFGQVILEERYKILILDHQKEELAINALTEQVVNIDKFNFNEKQDEKFEPKITWEQAYDKAIQFIAKNCPQKIKEINTEQKNLLIKTICITGGPNRFITFNFGRIVNGVAFNSMGFRTILME